MFQEDVEQMHEQATTVEATSKLVFFSPVQEHHLDFLLEEEFACNPAFLHRFLDHASKRYQAVGAQQRDLTDLMPCSQWDCEVVRSVTTEDGETDVLVILRAADGQRRIAILIEDKIRAGFQEEQAKRYQNRGAEGERTGEWTEFFTCLVSPDRYANDNKGFDTRVTLEELAAFFCESQDQRSKFKCGVFQRALENFANSGVKIKHQGVTEFRSFYADAAKSFFDREEVLWDEPRDAWWGDTWFNFRGGPLPREVSIVHKAEKGFLDLSFRNTSEVALRPLILRLNAVPEGMVEQTGKSASLRLRLKPVTDFGTPTEVRSTILEVFSKIRSLLDFYRAHAAEIQADLRR